MIGVFVREKHTIELLRRDTAMLEAQHQLPRAQPAIDENFAMIGRDQRAVPRAPATEHRQAEHGSKGSRVIWIYANRNQGMIAVVVLPKRREDARALQKLPRNRTSISSEFRTQCFGVRCVSASLLQARAAKHNTPTQRLPRHDAPRELHSCRLKVPLFNLIGAAVALFGATNHAASPDVSAADTSALEFK